MLSQARLARFAAFSRCVSSIQVEKVVKEPATPPGRKGTARAARHLGVEDEASAGSQATQEPNRDPGCGAHALASVSALDGIADPHCQIAERQGGRTVEGGETEVVPLDHRVQSEPHRSNPDHSLVRRRLARVSLTRYTHRFADY